MEQGGFHCWKWPFVLAVSMFRVREECLSFWGSVCNTDNARERNERLNGRWGRGTDLPRESEYENGVLQGKYKSVAFII